MLTIYDQNVPLGGTADVFHAFAPYGGDLVCFFRRHEIRASHGASTLWMAKWDHPNMGLRDEEPILPGGEDPRVISHDGQLLVFTVCPPRGGYVIYSYPSGQETPVILPAGLPRGKNWMPVSRGSNVSILHSFSPVRWLDIDLRSGYASISHEHESGLTDLAPHDSYPTHRGGSNAITVGDLLVGTGHITHHHTRHTPFQWQYNGHLCIDPIRAGVLTQNFGIVDPTSLWTDRSGQRWVAFSCSERDWFSGQRFASYICKLEDDYVV